MSTEMSSATTRVLITGAGGPAGVSVIRALAADPSVEVFAADMDLYAAGLYLVPPGRRWLIPAGDTPGFAEELRERCVGAGIDVLIPTVDAELLPLSLIRAQLADEHIRLALTGHRALADTLDKFALYQRCVATVRAPRTELLGPELDPDSWQYPVVVKPRSGSGSRGFRILDSAAELRSQPPDERLMVQDLLPGEEFSLDVLADTVGRVISVVPRSRLRVDSGVSVAGRTLHDAELDELARGVFQAVGLSLVANVQCRRDRDGRPSLLEVNPRFPGALPLTVASGVDMPRLCLAAVLGRPLPEAVPHTDKIMVRFLDQRFLDPAELVQPATRAGAGSVR